MTKNSVLLIVFVMLLSGCSSVPTKDIQIDTAADPKVNFSAYQDYAWLGAAAIISDAYGQWEPPGFDADAEIKYLIDRELRKRGMSQNSAYPDMMVAFAAGIDMDALELQVDPASKIETLTNVPLGGLMIALVDADSGFVIWAGVAIAEVLEDPDAETVKARLDYAVTKLLENLPE
jgi:hypothetical protein